MTNTEKIAESSVTQSNASISTPMKGRYVTLERLVPAHIPSFFKNLGFPKNNHIVDLITGFPYVNTEEELADYLFSYLRNTPELTIYAIKASQSHLGPPAPPSTHPHDSVLGIMGYRAYPRTRVIKIDDFLFSPLLQGSYASKEAHFLLLCHMFEAQAISYCRVWLVCNTRNIQSRQHVERMGYKYEGTFRKDNITRWGTSRDSDCLSMLDEEWPLNKTVLEKWLDTANFDAKGKQLKPLQEIRKLHTRSSL